MGENGVNRREETPAIRRSDADTRSNYYDEIRISHGAWSHDFRESSAAAASAAPARVFLRGTERIPNLACVMKRDARSAWVAPAPSRAVSGAPPENRTNSAKPHFNLLEVLVLRLHHRRPHPSPRRLLDIPLAAQRRFQTQTSGLSPVVPSWLEVPVSGRGKSASFERMISARKASRSSAASFCAVPF
jgi:hypothetical protein